MRVVAYDPFVGAERYRELGRREGRVLRRRLRRRRLPHAAPAQDAGDRGLARRRGARQVQGRRADPQRRPRPADRRRGPPGRARVSGKVGGAALDVFRSEPITEHPLFGYPNVVVTPHLGASTAEATDRAGFQAAEQVVAALTGGAVTTAVNVPAVAAEDLEVLGPFLPLCRQLGRLAIGARRGLVGRPRRGRAARPHRRARHAAARRSPSLLGVLAGPHRGGRQRGQRAGDRRGARHRARRDQERHARATSPTSCA